MSAFELTFEIFSKPKVVVTRTNGSIALGEYLKEFKKIRHHDLFDRDISYLHDLRRVDDISGSLAEHQAFADFAVSISSSQPTDVVFIVDDHAKQIEKFIRGYCLMACKSNRTYWIFTESKIDDALKQVGLKQLPRFCHD